MTPEQVQTIQEHLNLVFTKVTTDRFNKDEIPVKKEEVQLFNFDFHNPGFNVPLCENSGTRPIEHPGSTSDALFCSKVNQNVFTGYTNSNSAEGLAIHMEGEKEGETSLLKIC